MSVDVECRQVLSEIEAYLDGELDAVRCAAIERHCNGCPSCASVARGLNETIGLCRDAGRAPLPEPVRARAREQMASLLAEARRVGTTGHATEVGPREG